MDINTIAFKRRSILGEFYKQCSAVSSIPVFLNDTNDASIGTLEENLNQNEDAFLFYLPHDICKKLSTNNYNIGFDYDYTDKTKNSKKDRITLNHIILAAKSNSSRFPGART
jgi:hypothetical protein